MDAKTKYEYEAYIKDQVISRSMLETAKFEGREEGIEIGMEKGIEKGMKKGIEKGIEKGIVKDTKQLILALHNEKMDINFISRVTNLSIEEIEKILKEIGL